MAKLTKIQGFWDVIPAAVLGFFTKLCFDFLNLRSSPLNCGKVLHSFINTYFNQRLLDIAHHRSFFRLSRANINN